MAELGFGLMRLPLADPEDNGSVDIAILEEMVDGFLEAGMTYFDTAYYYHGGRSEEAIGRALAERHARGSFKLATKLPLKLLVDEKDPKAQRRIFDEQLARCGVDRFDSYLIHNVCRSFYPAAERLDSFGFLRELKEAGLIGRMGFSIHDDAGFLERVLDEHDDVDFVQLQVNYLDWDAPVVQSRRCCEVARSRGIPIVVMEPVRGGALADIPEEARAVLERECPGESPVSLALRFAAGVEGVETVLSGMSDSAQLRENVATMRDPKPLDDGELAALRKVAGIIGSRTAVPCTGCGYCLDGCPMNIPIPDYFTIYNNAARAPAKGLQPQRFYYLNRSAGHGKASDCIGCGRCETDCPQHIAIREKLVDVASLLERF